MPVRSTRMEIKWSRVRRFRQIHSAVSATSSFLGASSLGADNFYAMLQTVDYEDCLDLVAHVPTSSFILENLHNLIEPDTGYFVDQPEVCSNHILDNTL
jgi:hypothetical protein